LVFVIQHGSNVQKSLTHAVGEYVATPDEPLPLFTTMLYHRFVALAPGKFYGGEVTLDARDFPILRVPGKDLVKCQYTSNGFEGLINTFEEDIRKLPFQAWRGKVATNTISVEVIPTK